MKFSHLAIVAIVCCLGYIYSEKCKEGMSGYVYLLKHEQVTMSGEVCYVYIIVGVPTKLTDQSGMREAAGESEGVKLVKIGEYETEKCLETTQAVIEDMEFFNKFAWVPNEDTIISTGIARYIVMEDLTHSFEENFHKNAISCGGKEISIAHAWWVQRVRIGIAN